MDSKVFMLFMFCSVKPSIITEKLTFDKVYLYKVHLYLCFQSKVEADCLKCFQTSVWYDTS